MKTSISEASFDSETLFPLSYLFHHSVDVLAQELVGCLIITEIDGFITGGIISETEAYAAYDDKACHAYNNRKTLRNAPMFLPAGHVYVYRCYGLHSLFNIVTNKADTADAILIRSIEPRVGIETMLSRRNMQKLEYRLSCGPGNVSQCLGISTKLNGSLLQSTSIKLYQRPLTIEIVKGKRVGVDYAGKDADKLWRFGLRNSPWISKRFV